MKIVLIMGAFSYGGAERVMCNLANYLSNNKHEVTLVTLFKRDECYELSNKIKVINGLDFKKKFDSIFILRKIIKEIYPDIVLSFLTHINILTIISTLKLNIPVIISERNDPSIPYNNIIKRSLRRIFYRFAKGFVFQTNEAKNYFSNSIMNKSVVIPNPLIIKKKLKTKDIEREDYIVTIGRLTEQKNQELLIRSFSSISKEFPSYKLKIYGEGHLRDRLLNLIKELKMEKSIFLMGTTEDIIDEIDKCKIFVLSSNFEGMPNSLMEAMAIGLPCISTDCNSGGPRFLIDNNVNGLLVPINNEKILSNSMRILMESDLKRETLGESAMEISKKLNPEVIYNQWEILLNTVYSKVLIKT